MIKRAKKKYNSITKKEQPSVKNRLKPESNIEKLRAKKCLIVYLIADREYTYRISGRCTSFRSRRNISSFVIRNSSYGVEQRVFVNNPRLDIYV